MAKITKKYHVNRKAPFQVLWRDNGKRFSRFFETESARDAFIEMHSFLETDQFEALLKMPKESITDVAKIETLRGDIPFREIWAFWAKHHKTQNLITVWNACDSYIRDMRKNNKLESHVVRVRRILEQFCSDFGDVLLEHISRKELEAWLGKLPYGSCTKRNYKSILRTAWSYFEQNDWITKNVASTLAEELHDERDTPKRNRTPSTPHRSLGTHPLRQRQERFKGRTHRVENRNQYL